MNKNKVIYLTRFSGKAKSTGKRFNKIDFAELSETGDARLVRFFVSDEVYDKISDLDLLFGEEVICDFTEGKFMGSSPDLSGIRIVASSPYFSKEV